MAKTLSRRNFLKVASGAVGVTVLAACVPAAPSAPSAAEVESGEAPPAETGAIWVLHKKDFHPDYNDFIRNHIVTYAEENDLTLDVAYTAGFAGTGADIT